jgi:hypothetical protein
MTEMPRIEATRRERITEYALGMISESGWILAMAAFAYLMAVGALWFFSVWAR